MATAFVTGAAGFIGNHVAGLLRQQGWTVRGLKRRADLHPALLTTDIDWRVGDLRNFEQLHSAMAGCQVVFHVAADYRLWVRRPQEMYESNVNGTANVLRAALTHGVQRVVYTSSVGTLGLNADGSPADEQTPVRLEDMVGHYKRSKYLAERKIQEFLRQGLSIVLVHPSTPVGPGDYKPTPTGKIIVDFLNDRMPAYLNTGLNLVHVADVAQGHLLALEQGRDGEAYILGNQNLTLAEIFRLLEQLTGKRAPRFRLPYGPVLFLARLNELLSLVTHREPRIPLAGVKMAGRHMFFDAGKAVRELGLPQTPVTTALQEAVDWFDQNGYVRHR